MDFEVNVDNWKSPPGGYSACANYRDDKDGLSVSFGYDIAIIHWNLAGVDITQKGGRDFSSALLAIIHKKCHPHFVW